MPEKKPFKYLPRFGLRNGKYVTYDTKLKEWQYVKRIHIFQEKEMGKLKKKCINKTRKLLTILLKRRVQLSELLICYTNYWNVTKSKQKGPEYGVII